VDVSARAADGRISFAVEDRGPGVPEEDREKIFEAFVTTKTHGTGLGLAVVRKIVDDHGGTIEVRDGRDRGAVFSLALPRRRP